MLKPASFLKHCVLCFIVVWIVRALDTLMPGFGFPKKNILRFLSQCSYNILGANFNLCSLLFTFLMICCSYIRNHKCQLFIPKIFSEDISAVLHSGTVNLSSGFTARRKSRILVNRGQIFYLQTNVPFVFCHQLSAYINITDLHQLPVSYQATAAFDTACSCSE